MDKAVNLRDIQPNTALIAFSRADVLKVKSKLSKHHKVSVLYGNLSPEVRQDEAKRFRDGETDILVATDAIAMGLNLPIKYILFTTDTKFDGISKRKLIPNEIIQIAGRAGRFGHHEQGFIGATSNKVLEHIAREFNAPLHTIKPPFKVKATSSQIEELSLHLKTKKLTQILKYFSKYMKFDGPFEAVNLSSMIELSKALDFKDNMKLEDKYLLSCAPVSLKSPLIKSAYFKYANAVMDKTVVYYKPSINVRGSAKTQKELLRAEDEVKKISLYLWIAYKLPDLFPDTKKAELMRVAVNKYCEDTLKSKKLNYDLQNNYNDNRRRKPRDGRGNRDNKYKRSKENKKSSRKRRYP